MTVPEELLVELQRKADHDAAEAYEAWAKCSVSEVDRAVKFKERYYEARHAARWIARQEVPRG